eukprot:TRINITY_DN4646_c0_g1_i3.p1 TRINITY_DN4646_c0_g1~~TRINITY_DN4646_c0_g1_i3.p1  ORF type:complete len:285 (-),score=48.00 TRINITY_DN4646_c0_g1_i3:16-840(-)
MPLIVLCGIPSSGKTTRAKEIEAYFTERQKKCVIVNEESMLIDKRTAYDNGKTEKMARASLKASVERHISRDTIVISDSLNYIKGFRYELYCAARAQATCVATILCDAERDAAFTINETREDSDKLPVDLFNELVMRFETPNPRNKWDSVLCIVKQSEQIPFDWLEKSILSDKFAPKPNAATTQAFLSDTDFVHELERITSDIITTVLNTPGRMEGESIPVPHTRKPIHIKKFITIHDLRRIKKSFFKVAQLNPPNISEMGSVFVDYVNSNLEL